MKCQECGHELQSAKEYHPHAFCILRKAGINPVEFVCDAVHEMGLLNASGPPIPLFCLLPKSTAQVSSILKGEGNEN